MLKYRWPKLNIVLKLMVFFVLAALLFNGAQNVLKLDMGHRGTDNVKGFYRLPKESADVLFIGTSLAFCTADPLVIYKDKGITSYDFASSAQPFELSYLFMQEAFKTQKPKVIALEILSIYKELKVDEAKDLNYGLTDMPFSITKASAVADMFREDEAMGLSYLIPFFQYKDRWQELTAEDLVPWEDPMTFGAYTPDLISEEAPDFSIYEEETEKKDISQRNREIFRRMYELCKANGTELLVFKAPNVGWTLGQTKGVDEICREYGVPFLNFFDMMDDLDIDTAVDFRDNTHLNRTGSMKTSLYLADYLTDNYQLPDERGTDRGSYWESAIEG